MIADIQDIPNITMNDLQELHYSIASIENFEKFHKTRVLLLYIVYPLAMGTYFKRALERNPNVDLKVCGPYTGSWIPWLGGVTLPEKYAKIPDFPLPFSPDFGRVNYEFVKTMLGDWIPDVVLCVDAGINWAHKPKDGVVATVATDPHVLDYTHAKNISDKFFNMQKFYAGIDETYLPYAYDPMAHYPDFNQRDTDCVLIGMPYDQRVQWISELRKHGVSVITENGPVFDEYRAFANQAQIGLNWSSMNDLNARFFETPAFGLAMVANRVPDAHLFLTEGEDYLAFSTLGEAVEKVLYLKNNPAEIERIAQNGYKKIQPHTYDARVQQILQECGF